jgi:hypothetical protein
VLAVPLVLIVLRRAVLGCHDLLFAAAREFLGYRACQVVDIDSLLIISGYRPDGLLDLGVVCHYRPDQFFE